MERGMDRAECARQLFGCVHKVRLIPSRANLSAAVHQISR